VQWHTGLGRRPLAPPLPVLQASPSAAAMRCGPRSPAACR
jgi:hypothetical protein